MKHLIKIAYTSPEGNPSLLYCYGELDFEIMLMRLHFAGYKDAKRI